MHASLAKCGHRVPLDWWAPWPAGHQLCHSTRRWLARHGRIGAAWQLGAKTASWNCWGGWEGVGAIHQAMQPPHDGTPGDAQLNPDLLFEEDAGICGRACWGGTPEGTAVFAI